MFEKLTELGIDVEAKKTKLEKFMQLFLEYNNNVNLVSKNDAKFLFEKHIYDSLAIGLFLKENKMNINLLDIGTGGGFPSVPIAVCFDNIEVTAVDSTLKKIKFIEFAANELELKNINPVCKRAEELDFKENFDLCVSRAMAEMRIILEYAIPYVKTGGYFVANKSLKADDNLLARIESDLIAARGSFRSKRIVYDTFLALLTDTLKTEEADYGA